MTDSCTVNPAALPAITKPRNSELSRLNMCFENGRCCAQPLSGGAESDLRSLLPMRVCVRRRSLCRLDCSAIRDDSSEWLSLKSEFHSASGRAPRFMRAVRGISNCTQRLSLRSFAPPEKNGYAQETHRAFGRVDRFEG